MEALKFRFPTLEFCFDLKVEKGECVAVVGASGAGKSTLLNLIAGFEYARSGRLLLAGKVHTHTEPHLRPVSMLFQAHNLFAHLTVWQNMALGLRTDLRLSREEQDVLISVAKAVGLEDFLARLPSALSGGQRQRVALARCLLRNQPILLLDEPFSALDPLLRQEMLRLLKQLWQEKGLTVVLVTHQPEELIGSVDRVVRVEAGRVVEV